MAHRSPWQASPCHESARQTPHPRKRRRRWRLRHLLPPILYPRPVSTHLVQLDEMGYPGSSAYYKKNTSRQGGRDRKKKTHQMAASTSCDFSLKAIHTAPMFVPRKVYRHRAIQRITTRVTHKYTADVGHSLIVRRVCVEVFAYDNTCTLRIFPRARSTQRTAGYARGLQVLQIGNG